MKNNKLSSLSILIQVYNNVDTIAQVLEEAVVVGKKYSNRFEVLVVDDGSSDDSWKIIQKLVDKNKQIRPVRHKTNHGFGRTIKESYYKAENDYIFTIPGDRQIRADAISELILKINNYDMIVGYRKRRMDNLTRKLQSFLYNILLKLLFKINLHDVNSSKLIKRRIIDNIKLHTKSAFVDAELCITATELGYKIWETEIKHFPDERKKGGGGAFKIIIPVIKDMVVFLIQKEYGNYSS